MAMSRVSQIETLQVFNEKSDELMGSSFVHALLLGGGYPILNEGAFDSNSGDEPVSIVAPGEDSVKATVLTIRMFLQDNDSISIRRISNLYPVLAISDRLKSDFAQARNAFNDELDEKARFKIDGDQPTGREVLDTYLYGHYSHTTKKHRERYRRWSSHSRKGPLIYAEFLSFLVKLVVMIGYMRQLNKRAIAELQSTR